MRSAIKVLAFTSTKRIVIFNTLFRASSSSAFSLTPSVMSPSTNASDLCLQKLTRQLEEQIKLEDDRYRKAGERCWEINAALVRCELAHDEASILSDREANIISKEDATLDELVKQTILAPDMYNNIVHDTSTTEGGIIALHPRAPRLTSLSNKMEDYARYKAFHYFLSKEKLLPPNADCFMVVQDDISRNVLTDEEYIGGACIGLCHDLAKYGVTRAFNAVEDATAVPFITRVRNVVSLILEELLQFDFRNGPLRRKYDSTKYALKTIETVLYELSVAGAVGGHSNLIVGGGNTENDGATKRMKFGDGAGKESDDVAMQEGEGDSSPIPREEMRSIRERLDHRDKLRENLIKSCRDAQKAAKQAIFAIHRGDALHARKLLTDCELCVKTHLLPILEEEPSLRYGSVSGVMEEYVEGILFYTWMHGDGGNGERGTNQPPAGKILLPNEFSLKISTEDYLGGLCDLTGEIGRVAVARGTVRDKESVKLCLESNKSIYMTLKMLGRLPKNVSKKVGAVCSSVDKLERLLYEQSLMEMTGRKEFSSGVEDQAIGFENDLRILEFMDQ